MKINSNCHLLVVTGGKGGLGKSVLAANFAIVLRKELRAETLLLDLDAKSCGDQNIILGLRPKKTLSDLSRSNFSINSRSISEVVTQHPSGLSYIGAVLSPDQAIEVSTSVFLKQLVSLSGFYKYIVVDLGNDIQDLQMSVVDLAMALFIVTTPEVLVLNQTKKLLGDLRTKGVQKEMCQVILNRFTSNTLSPAMMSQSLNAPILSLLPLDDTTAYRALQSSRPFVMSPSQVPLTSAYSELVRKFTGGILQKLKALSERRVIQSPLNQKQASGGVKDAKHFKSQKDFFSSIKKQVHSELIKEMDLKKDAIKFKGDTAKAKELRVKTLKTISLIVDRMKLDLGRQERGNVIQQVLDEALGLGPLERLLSDVKVTEIMVNGFDKIYMEKSGRVELSPVTFTSNLQLRNVIERIVTPLGRRIDEKVPYVDARLADGSRVNAVIEPLSIDGPSLTIRKFPMEKITIQHLVEQFQSMTSSMSSFLRICVEQGLNVIVSGGTGSGKTTLLNVLSGFIPSHERIITVEDAAELQLSQEHVVRLETRPANMEGEGEISIRDLIRNTLRMRPDRIIVGECRDGAALDMLSAMNTGHDGSMTTVHSNNPREAISRLENLCLMAGMEIPARAIREQIASAVHLIVQIGRLSDGTRKVSSITEVVGMQGETVTLQEIFRFKEEGFDKNRKIVGRFQSMGLIPSFIEKFEQRGISIPRNLFTGEEKTNASSAKVSQSGNKSLKQNKEAQGSMGLKSKAAHLSSLKKRVKPAHLSSIKRPILKKVKSDR